MEPIALEPEDREALALLDAARPRRRTDCRNGLRPCPFLSCRYHLALEVTKVGSIRLVHPDLGLDEMPDTCTLDVAERGPSTLEEVGALLNVTKEAVRLTEEAATATMKRRLTAQRIEPGGPATRRDSKPRRAGIDT